MAPWSSETMGYIDTLGNCDTAHIYSTPFWITLLREAVRFIDAAPESPQPDVEDTEPPPSSVELTEPVWQPAPITYETTRIVREPTPT